MIYVWLDFVGKIAIYSKNSVEDICLLEVLVLKVFGIPKCRKVS